YRGAGEGEGAQPGRSRLETQERGSSHKARVVERLPRLPARLVEAQPETALVLARGPGKRHVVVEHRVRLVDVAGSRAAASREEGKCHEYHRRNAHEISPQPP